MTAPKRVIRKIDPKLIVDFDEQLWPVNVMLVILAGFAAGVIAVTSDFRSARVLSNGWFHSGLLIAIVVALAGTVVVFRGATQRRLQQGVFCSLLLHMTLCLGLYQQYLSSPEGAESDVAELLEEQYDLRPITIPEYHDEQETVAIEEFLNQPVESPVPETERARVERTEQGGGAADYFMDAPLTQSQPIPDAATPQRNDPSVARLGDSLESSHISRQPSPDLNPTELAPMPELKEPTPSPSVPDPTATAVQRESPQESTANRSRENEPTQDTKPNLADMTREVQDEAAPQIRETETAQRHSTAQPARTPDQMVSLPSLPVETDSPEQPLEPAQSSDLNAAMNRSNPSRPENSVEESTPQANVSQARARVATQAELPSVAANTASPRPTASNEPEVASQADLPEIPREVANSGEPDLAEPSTTIGRQQAATAQVDTMADTAVDDEQSPPSIEPALTRNRESASQSDPAVAESSASMDRADRSSQSEESLISSNVEANSTSTASSNQPSDLQPLEVGVARATGGASGLTRDRSFDADLSGATESNQPAVSAARRAAPSQTMEAGDAQGPSEPAKRSHSRAGGEVASATLDSTDVTVADSAGSDSPGQFEASASAALTRSAARAARGKITADAGSASVDMGAARPVAKRGEGPSSGGGEPSIAEDRNLGSPGRSRRSNSDVSSQVADGGQSSSASGALAGSSTSGNEATGPDSGATRVARSEATQGAQSGRASSDAAESAAGRPSPGSATVNRGNRAATDGDFPSADNVAGARLPRGARTSNDPLAGAEAIDSPQGGNGQPGDRPSMNGENALGPTGSSGDSAPRQSTSSIARRQSASGGEAETQPAGPTNRVASNSPRRRGGGAGAPDEPQVAETRGSGAAGRSVGRADLAGQAEDMVGSSASGAAAGSPADGGTNASPGPRSVGEIAKRESGGMLRGDRSNDDPGGLVEGNRVPDLGIPSRRARPDRDEVQSQSGRWLLARSAGRSAAEIRVQDSAVPGFRQRDRQERGNIAESMGGKESSERAVEMGLDFLARHQSADGSWSLHSIEADDAGPSIARSRRLHSDSAATGLALLAFLGAGYTHTDGKYRQVVARGLDFLIANQKANGDLFLPEDEKSNLNVWLYSHGIASIALCEAYGMTQDPALKDPAQRAMNFIGEAQNAEEGAWRYAPGIGSDTSVSGWQLMALKSGELAGLNVPPGCYDGVRKWLDGATAGGNAALYVYRPKDEHLHHRELSRVMTAESLLMRQYLGWKRDNPYLQGGADYLAKNLPEWGARGGTQRDAYYWYYATQVMFQMQGTHWQQWNDRLRPLLTDTQVQNGDLAGSWNPLGPTEDRWGAVAGRIYVTSLHLLILEVYYRHLPLYQNLEE